MRYEFHVTGLVSEPLVKAFPELRIEPSAQRTRFLGVITDEAQLYGLLGRFRDLGLSVEEMRRLPD